MTQAHQFHGSTITVEFTDRYHPAAFAPHMLPAAQLQQIHGLSVVRRDSSNCGLSSPSGDGHWTTERALSLAVRTADCVPMLVAGGTEGDIWVAALHCGWRSGLGGILESLLAQVPLKENSTFCQVWFGPNISACCFQVGPEVVDLGRETLRRQGGGGECDWFVDDVTARGKFKVDLLKHYQHQWRWLAHKYRLAEERLTFSTENAACTRCHPHKYFSYRAEGRTGNLYGIITKQ